MFCFTDFDLRTAAWIHLLKYVNWLHLVHTLENKSLKREEPSSSTNNGLGAFFRDSSAKE